MVPRLFMMMLLILAVVVAMMSRSTVGFSVAPPLHRHHHERTTTTTPVTHVSELGFISIQAQQQLRRSSSSSNTQLFMSDRERSRSTKKSVTTIEKDKTESQAEEQKKKEEMWRVVLHNDEVHTFNYVIRSLTKVVGTLDRKAAFEVCVQTHGIGKATVTKTWKKQAEQFCLGLQRQGLTVSISPDEDFDGGHSGGGL